MNLDRGIGIWCWDSQRGQETSLCTWGEALTPLGPRGGLRLQSCLRCCQRLVRWSQAWYHDASMAETVLGDNHSMSGSPQLVLTTVLREIFLSFEGPLISDNLATLRGLVSKPGKVFCASFLLRTSAWCPADHGVFSVLRLIWEAPWIVLKMPQLWTLKTPDLVTIWRSRAYSPHLDAWTT